MILSLRCFQKLARFSPFGGAEWAARQVFGDLAPLRVWQRAGQAIVTQSSGGGALAAIESWKQISGGPPVMADLLLAQKAVFEMTPGLQAQRLSVKRKSHKFF